MAFTTADIARLEAAIASGLTTVTYSGSPGTAARSTTYQNIEQMREELARMRREVFGSTSYRLARHRTGFRGA